jgi:hypothetical protein
MNSSRTTDTADTADAADALADEEQAAGTTTQGADADTAAEEGPGETGESEPEATADGDDTPGETTAAATAAAATADADVDVDGEPPETARRAVSSLAAGAAAVVGAGLGLASLTGTWLSDLMASRQELIGQIQGQTATPEEQVATIYGTPWHTTALFNGFFALTAIIVAGAALAIPAFGNDREDSPAWVRAVAIGGLALGTIGLVIAAVMWFDVFTELPAVPEAPEAPQG